MYYNFTKPKISKEKIELIKKMAKSGMNIPQITKEIGGISTSTVAKYYNPTTVVIPQQVPVEREKYYWENEGELVQQNNILNLNR